MGKNSTQRKIKRELKELRFTINSRVTGSSLAVQMEYAQPLFELVLTTLRKEDVDATLEIFDYYGLNPDILKEHLLDI